MWQRARAEVKQFGGILRPGAGGAGQTAVRLMRLKSDIKRAAEKV